jgi:hypothetical protein
LQRQFQGLIEVIQNADDVRAAVVCFALRETKTGRQLLIVHDGEPVTCHNVLGMALPFLTTKTERKDQRGRFGIGLKTLKRIATSAAIHSAPYHFSGDQLHFDWVEPEPALPGFYDPQTDTMLVLDLREDFDEVELRDWFDAWEDEGLLFLASVSSFRWCNLSGATIAERTLAFEPWIEAGYADPVGWAWGSPRSRREGGEASADLDHACGLAVKVLEEPDSDPQAVRRRTGPTGLPHSTQRAGSFLGASEKGCSHSRSSSRPRCPVNGRPAPPHCVGRVARLPRTGPG